MHNHYAIGIDLGGTNLRVALVSRDGEIAGKIKVPSLEPVEKALLSAVGEVLREGVAVRDLYRLAAERNVQIRKLSRRQDSLEDIFLKAMEN